MTFIHFNRTKHNALAKHIHGVRPMNAALFICNAKSEDVVLRTSLAWEIVGIYLNKREQLDY